MADRYARWAPEAHVGLVPPWAEDVYPHLAKRVIGPPRGRDLTGDIRAVEMLVGVEDGTPVAAAFLRIPQAVAQRMADEDGGWVHLSTMTNVVFPFSMAAYVALDDEPAATGGPNLPDRAQAIVDTLRWIASDWPWIDQKHRSQMVEVADALELRGVDTGICDCCEETWCDRGCPMAPLRDAAREPTDG